MNYYEKCTLELLKNSLQEKKCNSFSSLSNEDLYNIVNESQKQAVPLCVFDALPPMNNNTYSNFKNDILKISARNMKIIYEHVAIGKAFIDNNISYCILKGYASAYYYSNPSLRAMGDIDVLVDPKNVKKATIVLHSLGYKKIKNSDLHDFHVEYKKGECVVELHRCIGSISENELDFNELTQNILETAVVCKTSLGEMYIPSPYYHAIIMLFHVYRHFIRCGVGLRHLCDWAVFVNSNDYDLIEEKLSEITKEYRLYNFYQTLSQVSSIYLGIKWKNYFGKKNDLLCKDFMEDVLQSGNFGRKNARNITSFFMSTKLNNNKNNRLFNLFSSIKKIINNNWPKSKNNYFLLICGFVFFPIRYLVRFLCGKRKGIHIVYSFKSAKHQAKIHNELSDI